MKSLISAGFLLLRPSPRPEWASDNVLPREIISASACLCPQFPGAYAIEWAATSENERSRGFDAAGILPAARAAATEWATKNFQKSFGWPCVFYNLDEARAAQALFFSAGSNIQLIGLGLSPEFVEAFLEHAEPPAPAPGYGPRGESGWLEVAKHQRPLQSGRFLGFELLNVELGSVSHSWLCNHLEAHFAKALHIRVNEQGLLEDLADAKRCQQAIEKEDVGAEPGLWLPWGLTRYG